jgi:heme exporter protein A
MNNVQTVLDVRGVHVWRGDRHVLQGVSFEVGSGELLHVSGPNGAGKSTLLRVLCGLLRPEQGHVGWQGQSIRQDPAAYQESMTYAAHEPALKGDLTALENLQFAVGLRRRVSADELRQNLVRTGVAACADLPARVLSAGQRRRVALARVLALQARLWLLDEPFTNLDTEGSQLVGALLKEHVTAGGLAVVVAHHDLSVECPLRRLALKA